MEDKNKNEKEKKSLTKKMLTTGSTAIGVNLLTNFAQGLYGGLNFDRTRNPDIHHDPSKAIELGKMLGVDFNPSHFSNVPEANSGAIRLRDQTGKKNNIFFSDSRKLPVISHELGHLKNMQDVEKALGNYEVLYALRNIGGMMSRSILPTLPLTLSEDENKRNLGYGITTALGVPTLVEETIASVRGGSNLYKYLRNQNVSKAKATVEALKTFKGIPTYALAALSPILIGKIKDKLLFDKKEKK